MKVKKSEFKRRLIRRIISNKYTNFDSKSFSIGFDKLI